MSSDDVQARVKELEEALAKMAGERDDWEELYDRALSDLGLLVSCPPDEAPVAHAKGVLSKLREQIKALSKSAEEQKARADSLQEAVDRDQAAFKALERMAIEHGRAAVYAWDMYEHGKYTFWVDHPDKDVNGEHPSLKEAALEWAASQPPPKLPEPKPVVLPKGVCSVCKGTRFHPGPYMCAICCGTGKVNPDA